MKYIKILMILFCFISIESFSSQTQMNEVKNVKVDVPGMVCQMCVFGMRKSFGDVVDNPEKHVQVSLDEKTVTVILNKNITEEEVQQKIKDAGYNAEKITFFSKDVEKK